MDFFLKTYYYRLLHTLSLQVLSAARKVTEEEVHQHKTTVPGAAAPSKYQVKNRGVFLRFRQRVNPPDPVVFLADVVAMLELCRCLSSALMTLAADA